MKHKCQQTSMAIGFAGSRVTASQRASQKRARVYSRFCDTCDACDADLNGLIFGPPHEISVSQPILAGTPGPLDNDAVAQNSPISANRCHMSQRPRNPVVSTKNRVTPKIFQVSQPSREG